MKLSELATVLGADLVAPGDTDSADVQVVGVAPIQSARAGEVTFLTSGQYARYLASTQATAVILGSADDRCPVPQLLHENPYWAFAKATQVFYRAIPHDGGVSDRAFVSPQATLGEDVAVHAFAYVDHGVRLGDRCVLYPGCYVGRDVEIGDDSVLHANCVIESGSVLGRRALVHAGAVVGGDGFGFAPGRDGLAKIQQSGKVWIGDDVEIGPNSTVDRGAMADTRIGDGTKLDSQVQLGHNVEVGEHTMICGMTAIAGSAKIGNRVIVGGHAAVSNHCELGDGVVVGGGSGVSKNIPEGQVVGYPAIPAGDWRLQQARLRRLPKLEQRVEELERQLAALLEQREER